MEGKGFFPFISMFKYNYFEDLSEYLDVYLVQNDNKHRGSYKKYNFTLCSKEQLKELDVEAAIKYMSFLCPRKSDINKLYLRDNSV